MSVTTTLSTAAVAIAASVAAFVAMSTPGDQSGDPVTMTGCLRTGGNPVVYLLRGAAASTEDAPGDTANGRADDYLLVSIPGGVDLAGLVNHRASVTGIVSDSKAGPAPPNEANAAERALKRIAVQSVKEVAPNCAGG
jgi:hypothetical protein